MAARDIALIDETCCDAITLCPTCFGHLNKVKSTLIFNENIRKIVASTLKSINKEFKGTSRIEHFVSMLLRDLGLEKIKNTVIKPLNRLKVAPFYGCHILRPSELRMVDNPEEPKLLDSLIKITGAALLEYSEKRSCCGAPVMNFNEKLALKILREKLKSIQETGANAIVTICPFCHVHFDINQASMKDEFEEEYYLPVLHYTQLLGLAQGLSPEELGLNENRVPVDEVLKIIS